MSPAVKFVVFLYAGDACLVCQHKDFNKIENQLNKGFVIYVIDLWMIN